MSGKSVQPDPSSSIHEKRRMEGRINKQAERLTGRQAGMTNLIVGNVKIANEPWFMLPELP
jgi:hypothetical protein